MRTRIFITILLVAQVYAVQGQKNSKRIVRGKDSTSHIYIPIDIDDCIKQLDSIFSDSIKIVIKGLTEDEFSGRVHLNLGTWLRNNWGLWSGSRLSAYFKSKGVFNAEDMSGIIFDSYYRYLKGTPIRLDEQIVFYKEYWLKAMKEDSLRNREAIKNYKIGDTVLFNYRTGFSSKSQEDKYDNSICEASGVVSDFDNDKFRIKVKLLKGCDKRGIIYYDNKNSLVYNKNTNTWDKPDKHVVTYMKVGQIEWFDYRDWETVN
ncbi:DUF6794 domain-containing protein [Flavihumibacter profundi]|uniref:DUF6794 domain-containing protein n=1 Tax=Flavihumibacter profundi TaxID=2716883 RepID=UPI001CC5D6C4|nr:DUF6794 domain-containing protein [Flavihumibacter profundi]MBZ5859617.1 hypothetical protein [Flavihumibacter profundi]